MKKVYFPIISLLIVWCLGWSLAVIAATYDPIVEQAQQRLTELGYDPGPIDGKMGSKTEAAIKSFQRDQNLPVTGKLDEGTLQKLGLSEPEEQPSTVEQPEKEKLPTDSKEEQLTSTKQPKKEKQPLTTEEQIGALFKQAEDYQEAKDYDNAIAYYTKVLELVPTHVAAYLGRGECYVEQKVFDLAIADLRKVLVLKPNFVDTYELVGLLLIAQSKFDEAREMYQKAYNLEPENGVWVMNLGHTYLLTGNTIIAQTYYKKALPLIKSEEDFKEAISYTVIQNEMKNTPSPPIKSVRLAKQ